ncbi:MAG: hypothetical protein KDD10_26165, partial [Phaeodactylibacter sp.]|nr:hypothetical protein [Phaeodactylibacter sp.]
MLKHYAALLFLFFAAALPAQNLVEATFLESRTREELTMEYGFFIQHGVDIYKVLYTTPDVRGQLDTASGALVIPQARD